MPEFETPEPITATVEPYVGHVRIVASKRTTTVVEVRPGAESNDKDVRAAEQTRVTCSGGRLLVKGPRQRTPWGTPGMIDIHVELPAGSTLHGTLGVGDVVAEGPLGACELKTGAGVLQIEEAERAELKTSLGDVVLERVTGTAEVTGSGRIRIGSADGPVTVKNTNGDIYVDRAGGPLKAGSANGSIFVGTADANVDARTANGRIGIAEARRGKVTLATSAGGLEIGIARGTAAWLDVHSKLGQVINELDAAGEPGDSEETVEVHARTGLGDISVHRA